MDSDYTVTTGSAVAAKAIAAWILNGEPTERQIICLLPAANAAIKALTHTE